MTPNHHLLLPPRAALVDLLRRISIRVMCPVPTALRPRHIAGTASGRRSAPVWLGVILGMIIGNVAFAAATDRKASFDIPAAPALDAFKRFASQSGAQLLYAVDVVDGVRTNAVRGELTPREAVDRLLAGTPLAAMQMKNGAIAVNRTELPNVQRAAQLRTSDRPSRGPEATTAGSEEEAIELSPFVVSTDRDIGYLAQNSLSGSRLNTDLKDVGSPISTYTQEFIEDLATTDTDELAQYMLNVEYEPVESAGNQLEHSRIRPVRIRGLAARSNAVNFFTTNMPQDHFATERIDLSRGANSILFGIGSPGGLLNISTKRANLAKDAIDVSLQGRSNDGLRAVVDINEVIVPKRLALRVAAVDQNHGSWRHHEYKDAERLYVTGKFRATKKTEVNVEWEQGRVEQIRARTYTADDAYSAWLNAGSVLGTKGNSAQGRRSLGSAPRLVYDTTSGQLMNWSNRSASTGRTVNGVQAQVMDFDFLPKDVVFAGPGFEAGNDYTRFQAFLTHSFTPNLNLELAFSRTHTTSFASRANGDYRKLQIDTNPILPNGEPNPNAGRFYVEGFPFYFDRDEIDEGARITVSYERDFGKFFGRHRLAALYGRDRNDLVNHPNQREQMVSNPFNTASIIHAQNRVWRRTYIDLNGPPELMVVGNPRTQSVNGLALSGGPAAGAHVGGQSIETELLNTALGAGRNELYRIETVMGVLQSYFWNDRLVGIYGLRADYQDYWRSKGVQAGPEGPFAAGRVMYLRDSDPTPASATNQTATAVFHAFPWLSFTYNHSINSGLPVVSAQPTANGRAPQSEGKTNDIGVKLDLFKRKLFLTALYYETVGTNNWTASGGVGSSDFNSIWGALDAAGALAAAGRQLVSSTIAGSGSVSDNAASGYEIELIANPRPNWRLMLNYSHGYAERTSIGTEWQDYIAANRDFWLQGTNGRVLIDGSGLLADTAIDDNGVVETVAEKIERLDQIIHNEMIRPDGELARGQSQDRLNFRTNYSFQEGILKGFSLGGGVRYRSGPVVNYFIPIPEDGNTEVDNTTFLARSDLQVDLNLGYERRLKVLGRDVRWSLQLNVNNFLDETDVIGTRVSNSGETMQYRLVEPRQFILTSRFRF